MQICGIYAIENLVNGKVYIGQSVDIENRFKMHEWHLKNNCHVNRYLQRSWNKHGSINFNFEIIERCPEEELTEKEIFYIEKYRKTIQVYNLTDGGDGTRGHNHTEESKTKMSEARKGKYEGENNSFYGKTHTKETRKKLSSAMKGKPGTWIGRTHTEEAKKKMSEFHKGRPATNKGVPHTEKTKGNISRALKGNPSPLKGKPSPIKGKPFTEEHRMRISIACKGRIPWNKKKKQGAIIVE